MWTDLKKRVEELLQLAMMFRTPRGRLWIYNTRDPEEWQLYLWTRRN